VLPDWRYKLISVSHYNIHSNILKKERHPKHKQETVTLHTGKHKTVLSYTGKHKFTTKPACPMQDMKAYKEWR